jgi:AraC-like DNA-binding protein
VRYDWKAGVYRHATTGRFGHSLLTPLLANVFGMLGIAVTLFRDGEWLPIHSVSPNIIRFETEHGLSAQRNAYNERLFAAVHKMRAAVRGEHAGYADVFVPVVVRKDAIGILVAGPFATAAPTADGVLERWRWLTGRVGHLADPEFALYLRETLAIAILDARQAHALERLLDCFARLMAGQGRADEHANEGNLMRLELERARFAERAWYAVRTMIDERSPRSYFTATNALELGKLGLDRTVDHVLVGLMVGQGAGPSSVDDLIRRHLFQRRAVEIARTMGGALAGQVGDHGVVFLCSTRGTAAAKRRRVHDVALRAAAVARRDFNFTLHFGAASVGESMLLSHSYHHALAAAETALARGSERVTIAEGAIRPPRSLRVLRQALAHVEEEPAMLVARFEQYLEAVALHCGRRVDPAQAHLEVGFEEMASGLLESGLLDAKGWTSMQNALARAAADARNTGELLAVYRRALTDVIDAVERPSPARRDRSLRRAVEYIHQHFAEPLRIERVARAAGFTRSHFSRLFIAREGMPFETYVTGLRLERSQQLLTDTALRVGRVAELSGFRSAQYFSRVFRRALSMTPLEFRRAPARARGARNQGATRNSPGYKEPKRRRR